MSSTFELLCWRLLLRKLDKIERFELHAQIIREAEDAEAVARATAFPCLFFPCLFEERVEAMLRREALQERLYWHELNEPERFALPC
jgi:hypothetical protein